MEIEETTVDIDKKKAEAACIAAVLGSFVVKGDI